MKLKIQLFNCTGHISSAQKRSVISSYCMERRRSRSLQFFKVDSSIFFTCNFSINSSKPYVLPSTNEYF